MILRNALARWVGLAANLGVGLLTTPLLVKHLGATAYGVWLVFMSITGMTNFLDLGLATAVTKNVAADLARGDKEAAWEAASICFSLYSAIALVVAIIFAGLAWQAESLLNLEPQFVRQGSQALLVLGICTALSFPSTLFEGMLLAREQHHLVGTVETSVALLRLAALYLAVNNWEGLLPVGLAHASVTVGGFVTLYLISRRRVPLGRGVRPRWNWRRAKGILSYGGDTLMINLGLRVRGEGPVLLTNALAGASAVAPLGIGLRLISYQVSLVTAAAGATMPRFAALEVAGDQKSTQELLLRSSLYVSLLAAIFGLATWFLAGPFVRLWLGPDFDSSAQVVRVLIIPMGLYLSLRPCESLLYGVGRHRSNGLLYLGEAALMAVFCLFALPRWGAMGAVFSLGLALLLVRPWFLPLYTCRLVGLGLGRFWRVSLLPALGSALAAGLPLWWLFSWWQARTWLELGLAGLAVAATAGLAVWLLGLDRKERRFWLDKLRPGADERD